MRCHCTEALKLKPRYIKAIFRRVHANQALNKKREAILGKTETQRIKNGLSIIARIIL